jgi:hypothetical protein
MAPFRSTIGRNSLLCVTAISICPSSGDSPKRPLWSQDGREIFVIQGESLMAVSVTPDATSLTVGIPVKLFDARWNSYIPYDVLRDGTFALNDFVASPKAGLPTPQRVLMNWETLIKK